MTPKQFRKKYGVKVKGRFDGEWGKTPSGENWPHTRYRVTLKTPDGGKVKFTYRMGVAHTQFDRDGALSSFGLDVCSYESNATFEEFSASYGYDSNSMQHYKIWKACRKARNKAYEWCRSESMFEDLQSLEY